MKVENVLSRLQKEYGPRNWAPDEDPISVLVRTILSQNTSDVNSHRAFAALLVVFPSWDKVAAAGTDEIAVAIRSGGLAETKAKRIKATLEDIKLQKGDLDIGFIRHMPLSQAKAWLKQLPGVGPKTAEIGRAHV